jgi:lipopolysaccharide/colanic/teichoic acid biosynthesis glycosyltransferase
MTLSLAGLIILFPLYLIVSLTIVVFSGFPVFFVQKRIGLNGIKFGIIKFRTMQKNASKNRYKYANMNQADGPVFKIFNDPRFTTVGKILSRYGLDELPQLINVIKNDLSLVGPRPLPVYEANKLSATQKVRELVKPGITSLWVINGSHTLSFKKWMELDKEYLRNASLLGDIKIIVKTLIVLLK